MRCGRCVLTAPEASASLDDFHEQLARCDECPLLAGEAPDAAAAMSAVRNLVARQREAARALRQLGNRARRAEAELRGMEAEIERQEAKMALLERVQKASALEASRELSAKQDLVHRQEQAILALSTPIIHVWDGVVVLPIIGPIDAGRAEILTQSLLDEVQRSGSSHAILDLTGASEVTTETAEHLLRVALAVRLLGAEVLLTGMRSGVAQTVVALGVDLGAIRTMRDLKQALRHALSARRRGAS